MRGIFRSDSRYGSAFQLQVWTPNRGYRSPSSRSRGRTNSSYCPGLTMFMTQLDIESRSTAKALARCIAWVDRAVHGDCFLGEVQAVPGIRPAVAHEPGLYAVQPGDGHDPVHPGEGPA